MYKILSGTWHALILLDFIIASFVISSCPKGRESKTTRNQTFSFDIIMQLWDISQNRHFRLLRPKLFCMFSSYHYHHIHVHRGWWTWLFEFRNGFSRFGIFTIDLVDFKKDLVTLYNMCLQTIGVASLTYSTSWEKHNLKLAFQFKMENIIFNRGLPHVGEQIFESLDTPELIKSLILTKSSNVRLFLVN